MSLSNARSSRLDIGEAIKNVFGALGRNLLIVLPLAVVLCGFPAALTSVGRALKSPPASPVMVLVGTLVGAVTDVILQGAVIHVVNRDLAGARASMGDCLRAGGGAWGRLLGQRIQSNLAIFVGLLLAIIPGIIFASRWSVAGPAVVLEHSKIRESMAHSVDLTRGNRLAIFFLVFILFAILLIFNLAVLIPIEALLPLPEWVANSIGPPVLQVTWSLGWPALSTAIYRQLRFGREGHATEALAEVFA